MKSLIAFISLISFCACSQSNSQNNQGDQSPAVVELSQDKLPEMVDDNSVVVIDVRTPEEVAQGYIKGADKFIDFHGSDFDQEIMALDKSKTYVMYCRSGGRSGQASQFMIDQGFTNVYNLTGGISAYNGETIKD
jgi:rhodanese-related sulfurtransferase